MRSVSQAAEALTEAQYQVSSGRRINRLSEDPLGAAAALSEHAAIDRLDAYKGASDLAAYRLELADSVMSDIVSQLTAAQTTALSARGSDRPQSQRDAAANELLAIRDALLGDINTQFQGTYLFSGSNVQVAPYARTGSGISAYQGDTDASAIEIGSSRTVASTFDGSVFMQGGDPAHVLDTLTQLAAAIQAGDEAAVDSGVQALQRAFGRAQDAQARVGNHLKLIDDTRELMAATRVSAVARLSGIEDVDLAQAASRLSQAETAYRAALAAVSTIGRVSLLDYL